MGNKNKLEKELESFFKVLGLVRSTLKENSGLEVGVKITSLGKLGDYSGENKFDVNYRLLNKWIKDRVEAKDVGSLIYTLVNNLQSTEEGFYVESKKLSKNNYNIWVYKSKEDADVMREF